MTTLLEDIRNRFVAVRNPLDLGPLIDRISRARVVMLGESTRGTHEFYHWRRLISEWLIVKHGFRLIAVEGDWPACRALDRYISDAGAPTAREALTEFRRWPTWPWANTEMIRLLEWMRQRNDRVVSGDKRLGFFGLDVYSLWESVEAVVQELEKINLFYARQARIRYSCFNPYGRDERAYLKALTKLPKKCETQVVRSLITHLKTRLERAHEPAEPLEAEFLFDAEQNARIVENAEAYYRAIVRGDEDAWNVRDHHMLETLDWLLEQHGSDAKIIVWAHNTHIGDHRADEIRNGKVADLGGLARERYGHDQVALVGFDTYEGSVTASHAWGGPIETLKIPPARPGSAEEAFHEAAQEQSVESFYTLFDHTADVECTPLQGVHSQRAIGVVYDPSHEQPNNYSLTRLAARYDALFFVDRTTALQPLVLPFTQYDLPETWPNAQ